MFEPSGEFALLLIVTLLMIIGGAITIIRFELRSKKCTLPVTAQIEKLKNVLYYDDPYFKAVYSYSYNGKTYKGLTEYGYTNDDEAKKKYPIGSSITVYINPQNPKRSCQYLRKGKKN